jgi:drug/metabolite transporter (DMT)-like permease
MPRVQNGMIWMIIATFFFAFMGMFVKLGSPYFSEIELVFYRSFISLIFIILIIVNKKISLKTNFKKLHFYRSFCWIFITISIFLCNQSLTSKHSNLFELHLPFICCTSDSLFSCIRSQVFMYVIYC